jgi:7-keto-8-aminopelargonate synthetase-like enzyme
VICEQILLQRISMMGTAPTLIQSLADGLEVCANKPRSMDLFGRWDDMQPAANARLAGGLDQRARVVIGRHDRRASMLDRAGRSMAGLNFSSLDYLGLSSHDAVIDAVARAARKLTLASGGTAGMTGLSPQLLALERRVALSLGMADATVFPSGFHAGQAAVATLLGRGDHAVIDAHAHAGLRTGARLSGATLHSYPHASLDGAERRLSRLRRSEPKAGLLVATSAFFPDTATIPDLIGLSEICAAYRAKLLVDVAHDFGVLGPKGLGVLELQGLLGRADVVVGSFAKSFASNGGFVASQSTSFQLGLRLGAAGQSQSATLSALQASVILAAFDIIQSADGARRRARLMTNALRLRNRLVVDGFHVSGHPGPLVPVLLRGTIFARAITAEMARQGVLVNLMEAPQVPRHAPRWRLQLMSEHTIADIDRLAQAAVATRAMFGSGQVGAAPVFLPTGFADG